MFAKVSRHLLRCSRSCPCFPRWDLWSWSPSLAAGPLGIGKGIDRRRYLLLLPCLPRGLPSTTLPQQLPLAPPLPLLSPMDSTLETVLSPTDSTVTEFSPTESSLETESSPTDSSPDTESPPPRRRKRSSRSSYGLGVGKVGLAAPLGLGLGLGRLFINYLYCAKNFVNVREINYSCN
ncbi:hypothetical protein CEXT_11781 [Caerostris extrusa]|uniref:Uncharacterized protein n=1 Tax=Caerostris extrusa TaxID=172846 RepID=A0AAV4TP88_CAEEX|nr:hypothetical protein CEXT_11781 [Caerostris extrusa]